MALPRHPQKGKDSTEEVVPKGDRSAGADRVPRDEAPEVGSEEGGDRSAGRPSAGKNPRETPDADALP